MMETVAPDLRQIERDILEAVLRFGRVGVGTPATNCLIEKYGASGAEHITVVLDYLVEERLLFPLFNTEGQQARSVARGITPKGLIRLEGLRHPVRSWLGANWFAVAVAGTTAFIGIASLIINLIVNLD